MKEAIEKIKRIIENYELKVKNTTDPGAIELLEYEITQLKKILSNAEERLAKIKMKDLI